MDNVRGFVRAGRSVITFCFGISYIVNAFLGSPLIDDLNTVLLIVVIVLSFAASTGSSRIIGFLLFSSGIALLVYAQAPLAVWKQALQENSYLIVMFIMIPLLGIPVQQGGYSESLREVFGRYAHTGGRYYALVSSMSALIGVLLSIAAVPLTYEVARTSPHSENRKLFGTALSRGFITCMIWAPTSATIALVVQLTGIDWMAFFPLALACAVIAEVVGVVMASMGERARGCGSGPSRGAEEPPGSFDGAKIVELCAFAFVLIVSVMAVSYLTGWSVILVVAMASLLFPVLWMAAIKRLPTYVREFKDTYCHAKLPQVKNQIILFAGAGVFAQGIGYSHVGDALAGALLLITGQNALLLTVAILTLTLAASAVGIHPIAVVAVVGGALSASTWGVSPIYFALVLSISWALGNVICPASANVIAVSDMVGESPLKVGLRWSGPYVLVASVVLVSVLTLARMVGMV